MKSVMTHAFSRVPQVSIPRSVFNRSHGYKTTFDAGYLIPIMIDEALPGDTLRLNINAFARLATPIKPPMDNLFLDVMCFAAACRLVWTNFPKMMGEQANPADSISYYVPQMTGPDVAAGGIAVGSLSDYFGLPVGPLNGGGSATGLTFNSWFHRMYNLTWNQWFRDENLQNSVPVDLDDGPDTYTDYVLLKRGKRHDYFTSCLPWPQKGNAVTLPLGTVAPVRGKDENIIFNGVGSGTDLVLGVSPSANVYQRLSLGTDPGGAANARWEQTALEADLSTATAATINALRQAFQLQRMLERDARGGTRYVELIKSHFGVTSPDARLQRVEYLGGGSVPIHMHPVAQTTPTPAAGTTTPQGNLSAFGTAHIGGGIGFTKSFTEHSLIMVLVSVRADLTYQQGVDRMFNRRTRYDFYWPGLSHLGEQEVLNREIYANLADGTGAAQKDGVFGYQERNAEYRYKPSKITGLFRSGVAGSLDVWHLAQNFTSQPTLNATFIAEDPPIDRIIVTQTEPHFLFDAYLDYKCARPMPVFGVPGLIDHF